MVGKFNSQLSRPVAGNYSTNLCFIRSFTVASVLAHDRNRGREMGSRSSNLDQGEHYPVIRLSNTEDRLCRLVDRVAKSYEGKQGRKPIQLRIAGGWVRDKLLGLSCSDIDIGLESIMGYDFATLVADHLQGTSPHRKTIVRIASRPSKAKYLETATMFILGFSIDFVNLRSEVYDDPNRFPGEIVFGTPYEDAHHRDFTINALFYNIRTNQIEDYTGNGLKDLRDGWIRTPLKAFETFRQDPLRVLRGIRFASRFHFKLTEDVKQAIFDPRIRGLLEKMVSKERIRDEVDKMLIDDSGRSTAIQLLHELQLHGIIFAPPEISVLVNGVSAIDGEGGDIEDAFRLAWIMEWLIRINGRDATKQEDNGIVFHLEKDPGQEQLLKQTQGLAMTSHLHTVITTQPPHMDEAVTSTQEMNKSEQQAKKSLILSALLYPYHNMTATHGGKIWQVPSWIHKFSLKGHNKQVDITTKITTGIGDVKDAVNALSSSVPEDEGLARSERATMGILIRDIGSNKAVCKIWPSVFLFGLGVELLPKYTLLRRGILDEESKEIMTKYNMFLSKAEVYGIQDCFSWMPLVDGPSLGRVLRIPLGPAITPYLRTVMLWQLHHPEATKEECIDWILANPDKFRSRPFMEKSPVSDNPSEVVPHHEQ
ncbi:MAG: hypothetical protein J3Q66DRAFT_398369 [Benniella sp.]|nr:MAG: hypothetical protein J3Q66DRAFT_398369 [Benniella sp.]